MLVSLFSCASQISKSQLQQRGEGHGDTVDVENDAEMLALTAEIDEKVQASEAQGEAGNVDESMALLEQAERTCPCSQGAAVERSLFRVSLRRRAPAEEGCTADCPHSGVDRGGQRQAAAARLQHLRCQAELQRQRRVRTSAGVTQPHRHAPLPSHSQPPC